MRNKFPGYYKPTQEEFQHLWENATIVLDTNVLLDFYRFSEETTNKLFEVIEKLKDRIWLPYKVSFEYHENLNVVISNQITSYQDTIKTLEDFKKQIESKRSHPFLEKNLHDEIEAFCLKFDEELSRKKDIIENLIVENPIKERISEVLNNNVGDNFSDEELEDIYNEGAKRYLDKIPPGYKDQKDKKDKSNYNLYGDLIIWKSIVKQAKEKECCVILVTGDIKEDWFQKHRGKTIGPRPELIHEFKTQTGQLIYIYPTNTFLKYANEFTDTDVDDETLKEIGEVIDKSEENYNTNNQSVNSTIKYSENQVNSVSGEQIYNNNKSNSINVSEDFSTNQSSGEIE